MDKKEYIIYSRVIDDHGKEIVLYLATNEYYASFIKKEDADFFNKIAIFPTMNSAIIWWRSNFEWIKKEYGLFSSVLKYSQDPIINIGEFRDNMKSFICVHRLNIKRGDSPNNAPDPKTLTETERKAYQGCLERENNLRSVIAAITANAKEGKKKK